MDSAVIARITVPPIVRLLRNRFDATAELGVPAHVTLLYPFLSPDRLEPAVRQRLAGIAAAASPFRVEFEAIGRWPEVVYLAPSSSAPFLDLTRAIEAAWPDHPPYGGAFDEVIPHLSVAQSVDDAVLDAAAEGLRSVALPISAPVDRIEVLARLADGSWRLRWRIPLGARAGDAHRGSPPT